LVGVLPGNPHIYTGRPGLFDVDYLGHMNNASSLTHAELARWELTAASGALDYFYKTKTMLMVASTAVRYRQEIRPIYRKFEIHTTLAGIDDSSFYFYHAFRYPEKGNDRIRTQLLVKTVSVQGRKVVDPRDILKELGVPSDTIDSLSCQHRDSETSESTIEERMFAHFNDLEASFREATAADDEALSKKDVEK